MDQPIPTIAVEPPKFNWLLFSLIGTAILMVGIAAGFFIGKYIYTPKPTPTPLPAEASAKEGDPTANWKTYVNYKENISFNYPQNWAQREYDKERVVVGDDQTVAVTIFYGIYSPFELESPTTNKIIEAWFDYNIGSGAQFPDGGKVLSKETIMVDDNEATKYILVDNLSPYNQSFQRTWVFVPNNNRVTLLDNQGADNKLFDQILSTFKFVDQATPRPTCKPRPACLDATPRCMIAETSDMCPPNQKL